MSSKIDECKVSTRQFIYFAAGSIGFSITLLEKVFQINPVFRIVILISWILLAGSILIGMYNSIAETKLVSLVDAELRAAEEKYVNRCTFQKVLTILGVISIAMFAAINLLSLNPNKALEKKTTIITPTNKIEIIRTGNSTERFSISFDSIKVIVQSSDTDSVRVEASKPDSNIVEDSIRFDSTKTIIHSPDNESIKKPGH